MGGKEFFSALGKEMDREKGSLELETPKIALINLFFNVEVVGSRNHSACRKAWQD